jgi:hypothetical protein
MPTLLEFCGHGSSVMGAAQQTGESEFVFPVLRLVVTAEHILNPLK